MRISWIFVSKVYRINHVKMIHTNEHILQSENEVGQFLIKLQRLNVTERMKFDP